MLAANTSIVLDDAMYAIDGEERCCHLLGCDVMFDADGRAWMLEVGNQEPGRGPACFVNGHATAPHATLSDLLVPPQVNTNPSLLCGTAVDWDIKEPLAQSLVQWLANRSAVSGIAIGIDTCAALCLPLLDHCRLSFIPDCFHSPSTAHGSPLDSARCSRRP